MITINGTTIPHNSRHRVDLAAGHLYDQTELSIPVEIVTGEIDSPVLFLCAAVHGDEINGVRIIHRVLQSKRLRRLRGILIAAPIVNVYGFNSRSRYLPDRRDLNRCFPGSPQGSLASRMAHTIMHDLISKATHVIDFHTGALHKFNLPQVRACIDDPETHRLAHAFGTPVVLNANLRDGSLRQAAFEHQVCSLLYEGGEALRIHEPSIRLGVRGVFSVMRAIGMLDTLPKDTHDVEASLTKTYTARSSYWIRAPLSGLIRLLKPLGSHVIRDEPICDIVGPLGKISDTVRVPHEGVIIGTTMLPIVTQGDALVHVATFVDPEAVAENVDLVSESFD